MGAGGDGLIDNDSAQDYLVDFELSVRRDIIEFEGDDSRKIAASLSAAVGILLRLSSTSFDPIPYVGDKPHFYPRLLGAISHNIEHMGCLPASAPQLLAAVLRGNGEELASRHAKLEPEHLGALFGRRSDVVQGAFSVLELDLFAHPSSKTYMKAKTKVLVSEIENALKNRESVIDMSYSYLGGMLGLLLVLPFVGLKASKIEKWQRHFHKIWNSKGAPEEANDLVFELGYRDNVNAAFGCAAKLYANGG
jgi:hypothetical protein